MGRTIVYCAGPMFSPGEKAEQARLGEVLEGAGFEVFVPHLHGLELKAVMAELQKPEAVQQVLRFLPVMRWAVFALDVYQVVERCDCVVFNMNGRVPDEGGVVEAATAHMVGKPVVLYKDTPVSFIAGDDNPMVDGLALDWLNVPDTSQIPAAVVDALRRVGERNAQAQYVPTIPPLAADAVTVGRKIWHVKTAIAEWLAAVPDLIAKLPQLVGKARAEIDEKGLIRIGQELVIARLTHVDDTIREDVRDLWREFETGYGEVSSSLESALQRMRLRDQQ